LFAVKTRTHTQSSENGKSTSYCNRPGHKPAGVWVFSNMERWKLLPVTKETGQHPVNIVYTDTERLIGDAAKNQMTMNPNNAIFV